MKQTISNVYQFRDAFRAIRPDNFSYTGLAALWDYLESFEDDTGEELEFDAVGFCCDFSEESPEDIARYYSDDISRFCDSECNGDVVQAVQEYLEYNGAFVGFGDDGTIVYRNNF